MNSEVIAEWLPALVIGLVAILAIAYLYWGGKR